MTLHKIQVAHSLMDDVEDKIADIRAGKFSKRQNEIGQSLINGDLARAISQLSNAGESTEATLARARVHAIEGKIYANIAQPEYMDINGIADSAFWIEKVPLIGWTLAQRKARQSWHQKYFGLALNSFQKSIQVHPTQVAYLHMGAVLCELQDVTSAKHAFTQAQSGADREIAIDAGKALARI